MSRVHKVLQWETENLGHLHGQEVIASSLRASVRQLDALHDLPTPYLDTCLFPGLPVFGLWFTIIHGSRITGSEGTCSSGGSPTGSGFAHPTPTSDIPETSLVQGCQLPMHKWQDSASLMHDQFHVLFNPVCGFLGDL